MKYLMVCVRDSAADVFGVPNFVLSKGAAVRSFSDEVNRKAEGNAFNAHPEDFALFYVGTYDDEACLFDPVQPEQLVRGVDAFRKE